jgi:protein involved in polysaccharide export with SLBB domain
LSIKKLALLCLVLSGQILYSQDAARPADYVLGKEEKLEMDVHIWGEVKSPGEYRVSYNTNMVELISKAGGPTGFANLKSVRLARVIAADSAGGFGKTKRIVEYNLSRYLHNEKEQTQAPVLRPGDVVVVAQNRWYKWREIVRVAQEAAIIASVYVWYLRAK